MSMSFTQRFHDQHNELVACVTEISGYLNPAALKTDAKPVRMALAKLAGKLKIHLATEDSVLYPRLLKSSDEKVRNLAQKYISEMGSISSAFESYVNKWNSVSTISNSPDEFIKDTKDVFAVLAKRVEKENNELYPLAEKAAA